jgi:hypothetical protein
MAPWSAAISGTSDVRGAVVDQVGQVLNLFSAEARRSGFRFGLDVTAAGRR